MRRLLLLPFILFSSLALAHAGHGDGTFADIFNEMMRENFFLRPAVKAGPANAFMQLPDGSRFALDSVFWDAVRRQAANVDVAIDEPPREFAPRFGKLDPASELQRQPWGPYFKRVASNFKRSARRLSLDLTAATLDGFHRYGVGAAGLILTAEIVHHAIEYLVPGGQVLIPFTGSLCQVVQAGCIYVASRTQEYAHVVTKPFPGLQTVRERYAMLALSKSLRRARRRALKDVRDAGGEPVAFDPGDRALTDGAEVVKDTCFRSALAQPDADGVCQIDHAAGLRWKAPAAVIDEAPTRTDDARPASGFKLGGGRNAFGTAPKSRFTAQAIEDRPARHALDFEDTDVVAARAWETEDFVQFLYLKLDLAKLAAGDLRDDNARAFLVLRKQVSAMRRAVDLYAYTLRLRAVLGRPRTRDDVKTDLRFDTALTFFLRDFDRTLQTILIKAGASVKPDAPFRTAPGMAMQLLKDWIRPVGRESCATSLTSASAT